ncbi:hypothetical protein ABZY57_18590 [Streptomyces sp. NPDC006450]|uniref:hypothetical protein n=1 Tax=Streptomyces sp. NPDC006450 TaxID=3155458 RepID=UPI0033B4C533
MENPPGASEQLRLERAERMVKQAVLRHVPFQGLDITVASKGSYPNNANDRGDGDVDITVKLNGPFHTEGLAAWWFGQQAVVRLLLSPPPLLHLEERAERDHRALRR